MSQGEPKCGICGSDLMAGMFHECRNSFNEENARLQAEVESLRGDKELFEKRWNDAEEELRKLSGKLHDANLQKEEVVKEAKFRIELANLWISQLRKTLGKAMDALACDPEHDVSLQAECELVRRAVATEKPKSGWAICGWCVGTGKAYGMACPKCFGAGGFMGKRDDESRGPCVNDEHRGTECKCCHMVAHCCSHHCCCFYRCKRCRHVDEEHPAKGKCDFRECGCMKYEGE